MRGPIGCHVTGGSTELIKVTIDHCGVRMVEWFRALDFNAVTRVQIPLWSVAGVVLGKCLVQLLGHPCK